MKIYIIILSLVVILLKYRISKNTINKNRISKIFSSISLPFVLLINIFTFYNEITRYVKTLFIDKTVFNNIYLHPHDF